MNYNLRAIPSEQLKAIQVGDVLKVLRHGELLCVEVFEIKKDAASFMGECRNETIESKNPQFGQSFTFHCHEITELL